MKHSYNWILSFLKNKKIVIVQSILSKMCSIVYIYSGIYFFRDVVKLWEMNKMDNISELAKTIGTYSIVILIFLFLKQYFEIQYKKNLLDLDMFFQVNLTKKLASLPYKKLEENDFLNLKQRACQYSFSEYFTIIDNSIDIITKCLLVFGLIVSIYTYSKLSLLIILIIFLANIMLMKINNKRQYIILQDIIPIQRMLMYFDNIFQDFSYAKEIRLFSLKDYFMHIYRVLAQKTIAVLKRVLNYDIKISSLQYGLFAVQTFSVYFILGIEVLKNHISMSEFSFCFGAVTNINTALTIIISAYSLINEKLLYAKDMNQLLQEEAELSSGNIIAEWGKSEHYLQFKNVSFRYSSNQNNVLNNINITIRPGEKIAIVGENGAGKTTFIKLLLGLYTPTSGEIILNGKRVDAYQKQSYQELMSVVFQDFQLFSVPLLQNITMNKAVNPEKVDLIINQVGLERKINELPEGIDTTLYRVWEEHGVELSGGENQKCAIARACYQDSPILILDEPTAALDPVAEFEIYSVFDKITKNKTAIFISHRLSSVAFSTRILVMENAQIIEDGTKEELLQNGKRFSEMYQKQSHFYTQNKEVCS